ncbi:endoglucanase-like protein II [Dendryphion nanum]|uniref:AA9 family lytic polysaccharide monooxygenase n=1 Tax=Dendryphion nanum TaxID=256645 RepID=A0A9P9EI80_9PLEO|nr:endoglucanase-like protein II [Dendryphion nanum]
MKTTSFLALAAASALQMVSAHSTVYNILVNDVDQGLGNSASGYIRSPPNNSPIVDVTSKDMTCNVGGSKAAAKTIDVKAGDKVTFEWHHNNNSPADDIIDLSHKGPVLTYIAPTSSNGEGNVWVKLAEEGLSGGKWAVETLVANRGKHSITLPTGLAAGEYLLRPEIIALHEGDRPSGAQFYMGCVQVKVSGSGSTNLPAGVAIPGAYKATDAGVLFNLYNNPTSYSIPGPKVWDGATGGAAPAPAPSAAPSSTPTTPKPSASAVAPKPSASAPASSPKPSTVAPAPSAVAPKPSATAAPAPGNGNGGALPKTFTLETFIAWLRTAAGAETAKKLRRAHPRAFANLNL